MGWGVDLWGLEMGFASWMCEPSPRLLPVAHAHGPRQTPTRTALAKLYAPSFRSGIAIRATSVGSGGMVVRRAIVSWIAGCAAMSR